LAISIIGNADTTGLRNALKPGRYIDSISKHILLVDNDIANMDPDAKLEAQLVWNSCVTLGHKLLYFDRATYCVDRAPEVN
jgi:hypothetical protein